MQPIIVAHLAKSLRCFSSLRGRKSLDPGHGLDWQEGSPSGVEASAVPNWWATFCCAKASHVSARGGRYSYRRLLVVSSADPAGAPPTIPLVVSAPPFLNSHGGPRRKKKRPLAIVTLEFRRSRLRGAPALRPPRRCCETGRKKGHSCPTYSTHRRRPQTKNAVGP